jgi:DNA ligase 4
VLKDRLGEDFSEATSKRSKLSSSTSLSVRGVNQLLDEISLHHLIEERRDIFLKMTAKMSASEQKWLTRIILKGLRVGLPDGQVLKLLHPDAPAIYDVRMNLSELVRLFQDPKSVDTYDRDAQLQVKLFYPFKPMLAERQPLEKAAKTLNGSFYIEPKLDGERCLLHFESSSSSGNNSTSHKSNSTFRYFSRQGTEFTYLYGRNGSEGSLTPKIVIEDPFYEQVASVVLDGEMVVYDPLIDKYLPFGTLKSSAGARYDPSRGQDCEPHPCLVIFDVVCYNGQSLLNWTLTERISLLHEKVIKTPIKGYLDLISRSKLLSSTEDITTALDEIIQDQGEGLILKDPLTPYIPAHRSTHWIKIKPEYVQGLCDDLDVVIIGAWYGRSGNIKEAYGKANEFLCGIWSDDKRYLNVCGFCILV